jgi:hypothetical protein
MDPGVGEGRPGVSSTIDIRSDRSDTGGTMIMISILSHMIQEALEEPRAQLA